MQLSKQEIDTETKIQINQLLYQLLADLRNSQEANKLLSAILTATEITTIAKRITIAKLLTQGQSYEQIRDRLKVSSATIATVQSKLSTSNGYSLVLQKIQADQWATKWAKKISSMLRIQ